MAVELPKDAEGREIPLDTEILYDAQSTCGGIERWNGHCCDWEGIFNHG